MILNNRYKQYLHTIFSSVETPFEVWAYGSRVDGSAHEGSDLDLVVRTPNLQKLPIDTLMTLKKKSVKAISQLLLNYLTGQDYQNRFRATLKLFTNYCTAILY